MVSKLLTVGSIGFLVGSILGGFLFSRVPIINAELLYIWRLENKSYMQALHFAFAFGGILSPLATVPFLTPPFQNSSHNNSPEEMTTTSETAFNSFINQETKIDTMSRTTKTLILMIMLALIGVYNAVEESFAGFVTTFCVKQLHWSKTHGSIAASVFWATFGGGRFSGIFLIRLCSPACMIDIYGVFAILSFVGLLFSSLENYDVAVWSCIVTIGISLSVFSPTIFTWTEEMIHVTGNIASGLKVAANTGSMVNSVILGILIDRYTPLWFCYLLLGEC
ncbi:hypothetical protein KUTeg_008527, partial [Tegillarca granosa]